MTPLTAPTRVGWVSVAVWRAGPGLHRQPRCERQYVVVPPDQCGTLWRVWLAERPAHPARRAGCAGRAGRVGHAGHAGFVDVHTSVELTEDPDNPDSPDRAHRARAAERADVLRLAVPAEAEAEAVDRTLDRYPGCLVALAPSTGGGCLAAARDGTRVTATPTDRPGGPRLTGVERAGLASFLHTQLVLGLPLAPRGAFHTIRLGGAHAAPLCLSLSATG